MVSNERIPDTVASTDGVTLKLYDLGGSGPLLVMSHATGFCGQVWEPMAQYLSAHFHCIAFDFRAHGRSTRPIDRPLEWTGFSDDVLAVFDAVSPDEPVAAVGHSMGGAALALAEASTPGRLSKAWTYEPILFEVDEEIGDESPEIAEGARRRRATFSGRDEVLERYRAKSPLNALDDRALRAYVDGGFEDLPDGTVTLRCRPEDEASVFEHHNSGARRAIGRVTVPFAVAASGDGMRPAIAVAEAAAEFGHLELFKYEGLTHFGPMEDPERLAADVVAWMAANG
ncbi:MAG: alpha/beta fold hydrolase [Acidimicrobiales bacterium]